MRFPCSFSYAFESDDSFQFYDVRFIMSPKMCDHKSKKKCKNKNSDRCEKEESGAEEPPLAAEVKCVSDGSPRAASESVDDSRNGKGGECGTKKPRAFREVDLERILYRWYDRRQAGSLDTRKVGGGADVHTLDLLKKASNLARRLGAPQDFVDTLDADWIRTWQERYGVFRDSTDASSSASSSRSTEEVEVKTEKVSEEEPSSEAQSVLASGAYSDDQIYVAFGLRFDRTSLPDKTLDVCSADDAVWLLMAGNRSGRHRTRVFITGKRWRPACLQNVNMLSQPVVYAGGGVGRLTPDLFAWWFQREFSSAALALNAEGAVLLAERSEFVPSPSDCVAADGKVKLLVYEKGELRLDLTPVESELRARYAMLLLHDVTLEHQRSSVVRCLSSFTLKDSFPLLHRAWLNVRPDSFGRCWSSSDVSNPPATRPPLSFDACEGTPVQIEEDRMLLLELQWLCHDLGLEVTDEDLSSWVSGESHRTAHEPSIVKSEPDEQVPSDADECSTPVSGSEAAACLAKALSWMESEPVDPNLLLIVRDVMAFAKQASKMGLGPGHPGTGLPFFCHNGEHLTQPPPAHMGIPPYQLDPKGAGLTRAPMYPFTTSQYPYPMLSPEMSQVAASWHTPSMYPISSASAGFRSPYPTSLPISSSSLTSDLYRFSPSGLMAPHPGLSPHSHPSLSSHPAIVTPGPKQDLSQAPDHNHRSSSMDRKNSSTGNDGSKSQDSGHTSNNQEKKPHIKKPLNAFMLYMKEMRAQVVAECTLKESAAINQILGRRWHSLTREEQAKYYEKARQERQLHMELYPGWSARDNYGYGTKKKKRKKERVPIADTGGREEQAKYYELARRERQLHMQLYPDWSSRANATRGKKRKRKQETNDGGNNMKKCRARYGLDQQSQWCKPCRRKKKCIRYMECGEDGNQSEDNLGSCGSVGEAQTPPEDDSESFHPSISSPGGLSGLSSLTSPSMILPSPSASMASPSVSLASPCMSLQSPLTPHALDFADCNGIGSNKPPPPPCLPLLINHHLAVVQPHRNPVGTNPHDINNPLSVNQLTGKCIKNSSSNPSSSVATSSGKESTARPVISVP